MNLKQGKPETIASIKQEFKSEIKGFRENIGRPKKKKRKK